MTVFLRFFIVCYESFCFPLCFMHFSSRVFYSLCSFSHSLHVLQSRGYIRLLPERRVPHLLPARGMYLFRRAVQTFYIFPTPVPSLFQISSQNCKCNGLCKAVINIIEWCQINMVLSLPSCTSSIECIPSRSRYGRYIFSNLSHASFLSAGVISGCSYTTCWKGRQDIHYGMKFKVPSK